ncbi:hypothetical protein lerEdw1_020720 [Lerista edwardsae]|nr:hypothetical protein lerEdw1_020720 [Lerista edwardsae]
MQAVLVLPSQSGCREHAAKCPGNDPLYIPQEWYQPGDKLIGGLTSHIYYLLPRYSFEKHPSQERVKNLLSVLTKLYQHILALAFAVHEVNGNPHVLPNITLGFHICDNPVDARMAYRITLELLFKSQRFVPNYRCSIQNNVMGTVGGLDRDTSAYMEGILSLYKIPQV